MVEKIPVRPESVRGLGNIISPAKTVEDFSVFNSSLSFVDGFYTMEYSTTSVRVELTASASSIRVGESLTLTATVTDGGTVVEGASVSFTSGNLAIGTAVTGSDGVATLTVSTLEAGSYSITATYDEVVSSAVTVTVSYGFTSVTVTSDKSILSYADSESATLTAQLMNGASTASVGGETVEFYRYVDGTNDVLVDSGQTDNNGVATGTYTSAGIGDIQVYAKVRSLVSKTYSIRDIYKYDSGLSDNTSKYTIASGHSLSYDSTNQYYILKRTSNGFSTLMVNDVSVPNKVKISYEVLYVTGSGSNEINTQPKLAIFNGNNGIGLKVASYESHNQMAIAKITKTGDIAYGGITSLDSITFNKNAWYTVELIIDGSTITGTLYDANGTVVKTQTGTESTVLAQTGNNIGIQMVYATNAEVHFKELKVEPL